MRVAIVIPYVSNSSSGELRLLLLAEHLRRAGIVCDVFRCSRTRDDAIPPAHEMAGLQFCLVDDPAEPSIPAVTSAALMRRLGEGRYDVIVLRGMRQAVNDQIMDGFGSTVRYANIPGGVAQDRHLARYGFIFYEHDGQADLYRHKLAVPPVLHRLPKYLPQPAVAAARAERKSCDVSVVSKFVERKNHRLLYPLFGTDLRIRLIGSGPLRTEVEAAASGRPNVAFLGDLDWRSCIVQSAGARVLAHPSLYEGLPRAVVEAASAGLPVVALRSTLGPALHAESFCDLVEPSGFCDAVSALLADAERLSEMSRAAQAWYDAEHGPAAMRAAFEAFVSWVRQG